MSFVKQNWIEMELISKNQESYNLKKNINLPKYKLF